MSCSEETNTNEAGANEEAGAVEDEAAVVEAAINTGSSLPSKERDNAPSEP